MASSDRGIVVNFVKEFRAVEVANTKSGSLSDGSSMGISSELIEKAGKTSNRRTVHSSTVRDRKRL